MADDTTGETKPKQESEVLNLTVKDQHGSEVQFRVKTYTKLEKVRVFVAVLQNEEHEAEDPSRACRCTCTVIPLT
jgi:hypothetical protein